MQSPSRHAVLPYRPQIDGLRAVAVLAVLLFHAELGPFRGGFAGVDVFFVISGFLITGILLREQAQGSFSLARFYARRARRILPALAAMGVACVPAALLLMSTEELKDFGRLLAATAFGASNLALAATSGYYEPASELRPLLHTWTLGVEEQFYLVLPLLMLAAPRLGRRRMAGVLLAAAVGSLGVAEWGWRHHAEANFFLTPGRAWELLAGCLCAFATTGPRPLADRLPARLRGPAAAAGLAAVLLALLFMERHTPAPSVYLLLPVLGTAAVLLYAASGNLAGRVLAHPALVQVGLISYSVYLWHQPLLAFARLYLQEPLPLAWRVGIVVGALVAGALSWRFVEQPLRHGASGSRRTLSLAASACGAVGAIGALCLVGANAGAMSSPVRSAFQPPARADQCFDIPYAHEREDQWTCQINPDAGAPDFVLFGDSHALHLLEAFEQAAEANGRAGVFAGFSGCPPLLEVVPLTRGDQDTRNCAALNRRVLDFARSSGIRDVYLVARWSYYTDTSGGVLNALGRAAGDEVSQARSREAFREGFAATLHAYAASGVRVHVVEQVPQQAADPRRVYEDIAGAGLRAAIVLRRASVKLAEHRALQAFAASVFRQGALRPATLTNLDALFCDTERCPLGTLEQPYYLDHNHLSVYGTRRAEATLTTLLQRDGAPAALP